MNQNWCKHRITFG